MKEWRNLLSVLLGVFKLLWVRKRFEGKGKSIRSIVGGLKLYCVLFKRKGECIRCFVGGFKLTGVDLCGFKGRN